MRGSGFIQSRHARVCRSEGEGCCFGDRRKRTTSHSRIYDYEPLRRDRRRACNGLSRGCAGRVPAFGAVPSDRNRISRAGGRDSDYRKIQGSRRACRECGRRAVRVRAGAEGCRGGEHHTRMFRGGREGSADSDRFIRNVARQSDA